MLVELTPEDVRQGTRGDPESCTVRLARQRAGYPINSLDEAGSVMAAPGEGRVHEYRHSRRLQDLMETFDCGTLEIREPIRLLVDDPHRTAAFLEEYDFRDAW